jgi:hypothetical protein
MTRIGVYPLHHEAVQIARKQGETREHDTVLVDLIIAEASTHVCGLSLKLTPRTPVPASPSGPLCSVH